MLFLKVSRSMRALTPGTPFFSDCSARLIASKTTRCWHTFAAIKDTGLVVDVSLCRGYKRLAEQRLK